jgi:hypothetical protein
MSNEEFMFFSLTFQRFVQCHNSRNASVFVILARVLLMGPSKYSYWLQYDRDVIFLSYVTTT